MGMGMGMGLMGLGMGPGMRGNWLSSSRGLDDNGPHLLQETGS